MLKEAWTVAIEALSWMEMRRLNEQMAFAKTAKQLGVEQTDTLRLARRFVYETTRRKNTIDRFIGIALKPHHIEEFDLGVQSFLRLYVYQTRMATDRSEPDIKEAENIATMARSVLGWKTLRPVERFLGTLLTNNLKMIFDGANDEERIGLLTHHPAWWVAHCYRNFGRAETIALLQADTQRPATYVRLNTLKASEEQILQDMAEDGIKTEKVENVRYAYKLISAKQPLPSTPSFKQGFFYIQDKASILAGEIADPQPHMTVLDICAAPGVKTTHLAQLMQNQGQIYSVDYSRRRMIDWKRETQQMDAQIAEPVIADVTENLPLRVDADVVVLDPPCTSTGLFRKVPSAKWRLSRRSIERMADIQWNMIDKCSERVKIGGSLIYSTCSMTVEENEMVIERFLKRNPEFSLAETRPKIGLPGLRGLGDCQRLYPHIHDCNGFFVAKLSRKSP